MAGSGRRPPPCVLLLGTQPSTSDHTAAAMDAQGQSCNTDGYGWMDALAKARPDATAYQNYRATICLTFICRGICMMSTSWRDKQDHHLINFIGAFLAANSYRLNFLSISLLQIASMVCSEKKVISGVFRTSSSTMGAIVALIFETNWGWNGAVVLAGATLFPAMVNALKRQYKNLYVFVAVPTVEQIESFNQSYFKYGMELGCPTFVPVNDSEMGFEMMLKIAHARGVCKQQDISSTMRNEREQAVQSMDAYIRVLTSIPGIDDHDANMDVIGKTDHEILSGEGIDEMNKVKREVMAKGQNKRKNVDIRVREAVQKAKKTEHSRSPNITEVLRIAELLATTKLGQEQHQLLELRFSSGNAVLQSIDGILGLSKVESGVIKLQSAIFRPREVVEHVLQTASSFMKKELTLEGRIGDDVSSEVIGDALKIQEILTNLIRTFSEYYIGLTTEIPAPGEGQRWSRAEAWVV
ncbi:hypothetical protein ZWY2020_000924 [Hordeum vulgare]|nr:hypothetical protein ZWY2020_000924 [Hordeum vulgare]